MALPPRHEHDAEHQATHGMLIVGDERVIFSHLPMFHTPHDRQVLLEVSLTADSGDPLATYRRDRQDTATRIYTWVPRPFVLTDLVAAPANTFVMTGTIFRGHFERGGVAITSNAVKARVVRVLFSRRFSPLDAAPAARRFLIFGSRTEPFLAHRITKAPDFDHVAGIEITAVPADWPADWDGSAIALQIPGESRLPGARLGEGDQIRATRVEPAIAGAVDLTVRTEFYFETGDLES